MPVTNFKVGAPGALVSQSFANFIENGDLGADAGFSRRAVRLNMGVPGASRCLDKSIRHCSAMVEEESEITPDPSSPRELCSRPVPTSLTTRKEVRSPPGPADTSPTDAFHNPKSLRSVYEVIGTPDEIHLCCRSRFTTEMDIRPAQGAFVNEHHGALSSSSELLDAHDRLCHRRAITAIMEG